MIVMQVKQEQWTSEGVSGALARGVFVLRKAAKSKGGDRYQGALQTQVGPHSLTHSLILATRFQAHCLTFSCTLSLTHSPTLSHTTPSIYVVHHSLTHALTHSLIVK